MYTHERGPIQPKLLNSLRKPEVPWLPGTDENANYEFSISLRPTTPRPAKVRKRDRDRAEARRPAGEPKPSLRKRAIALAHEMGTVRTHDFPASVLLDFTWRACATRAY